MRATQNSVHRLRENFGHPGRHLLPRVGWVGYRGMDGPGSHLGSACGPQ